MAGGITLNAGIRSNLLSLQNTTSLIGRTQSRLSTGLKVSSAVDDPSAFFRAKGLQDRASDFSQVRDNIDQGVSTLKVALEAVEGITSLVEQAKGIIDSARQTSDTTELNNLETQYDEIRSQIDSLASDANYNGLNLVQGSPDNLVVNFNEDGSSDITISGVASNSSGLSLAAAGDFTSDLDTRESEVNAALNTLRSTASSLGTRSAILTTRLDFTKQHINSLQDGAGKLVNADINEEAANLLSLQTRQQLGTNALSLAAQSERSVLGLLG